MYLYIYVTEIRNFRISELLNFFTYCLVLRHADFFINLCVCQKIVISLRRYQFINKAIRYTKQMKKLLSTLCAILACANTSIAQVTVSRAEFEAKVGATCPTQKYFGDKKVGPSFGLEGRMNLSTLPIDIGGELYLGAAVRKFEGDDQSNRILSFSAVSHYNFQQGTNFSPFIGFGLGIGSRTVVLGVKDHEGTAFVVSPRFGIELFRHLRLTLEGRFAGKGYDTIGLTLGGVIGGGKQH